jgi:CRP/FNR family transcriptional regulator, cyclic AMP receptor protein
MERKTIRRLLKQTPLFADLDQDGLGNLSKIGAFASNEAGNVIFHKGDPGDQLYVIISGTVGIFSVSMSGKTLMHNRLSAGTVMGEIALMSGRTRSAGAMAVTDCEFFVLAKAKLLEFLELYPKVAVRMSQLIAITTYEISEKLEDTHFLTLRQRVAKLLLHLADDCGVTPTMRQEDYAQLLGVTREAINKVLSQLESVNSISMNSGVVIIPNVRLLRDAADLPEI